MDFRWNNFLFLRFSVTTSRSIWAGDHIHVNIVNIAPIAHTIYVYIGNGNMEVYQTANFIYEK